jgi:catechol 2,3-dioxygenase-like lactoylglutathione lyase family enzyme
MARAHIGSISPFFIVNDVERSLAFYCDKLGFETRFKEPKSNPFFGIVGRDGAQLFVKSHEGLAPMPNTKRHPWIAWDSFVYVQDPDALAAEFSGENVEFKTPLADTHDGLRGFTVSDPDGYVLFFGRPLVE